LGLYCKASDKFSLIGSDLSSYKNLVEKELKVNVFTIKLYNSNFIGLFSAFNSNGIVLSKLCYTNEINEIKKNIGVNIYVSKSKYTAIGNLILTNDKGCIISKKIEKKEKKEIENVLGVEVVEGTIAKLDLVGSSAIATNKFCLLHRDAKENEIELVRNLLKVEVGIGTINTGSPYIGYGMIANSNGFIVSEKTTPIEINRILEILRD
ncbi:MAG: translation initiation factor IF-6, partial [Candidatus Aenigmarchaeota archaeon]|nr:translation initiation factor IF-6 [Candidatus Aenigmarchaeota archaeon]MDW8149721.1 translation initiation factor IF-6 [Candidatus Aenigmarchaeota archaeon]